jgi:hypothetical protein
LIFLWNPEGRLSNENQKMEIEDDGETRIQEVETLFKKHWLNYFKTFYKKGEIIY